jgi:hypothetical protein
VHIDASNYAIKVEYSSAQLKVWQLQLDVGLPNLICQVKDTACLPLL